MSNEHKNSLGQVSLVAKVNPEKESSYRKLLDAAIKASEMSYCPYSDFPVGAALLTAEGKVFTGCNVENASFGGTICAERTAIIKAVSEGYKSFKAIAIHCKKLSGKWPCGMCRQFICEFGLNIDVVILNTDGALEWRSLEELLPGHFGPESLQT